jgi:hypothetical protein
MNIKSTLFTLICLFVYTAKSHAQTPHITALTNFNERLCANTVNKIPVQISGSFNTGNRFQIELLSYFNRQVLGKYEATYEDGNLVFVIDKDLSYTQSEIYFQITTTSPVTKSYQYERRWNTRGSISISLPNGQSDTLNAGKSFPLNVNVTANNFVTFTLSDSSTHQSMASAYQQMVTVLASKSQDIFIVKAVNSCDIPVPFSGKIPLKINPISIIPGRAINKTALCEGSNIELSYFTSGGSIPESATFKLRFFKEGYSDPNEKRTFEIPAMRKADGILTAVIPDEIVQYSNGFQIAIVVDKPGLVSPYSNWMLIHSKPTASFSSQSETIKIGESVAVRFKIDGPPPFTIELNNGVSYKLDHNNLIDLSPTKTESFSIRSLTSACGTITDLPKENILISVSDGVAIGISDRTITEICENQRVRLPLLSNIALNSNTKYMMEGITDKNISYEFEAKLVNDSLEFFIPHSPANSISEGYFNIRRFRVKTSNPATISDWKYNFTIRGIPRIAYEVATVQTINGPQYINHNFEVHGGVPVTLTDDKGNVSHVEYQPIHQTIFVPKTGVYGLKSIKNVCYSNTNLPVLNVNVTPYNSSEPSIVVHPPVQKYLCNPDSVEINFEAFGQFDSANEFQIMGPGYENNILLTVKSPGRYKIPSAKFDTPSYNFIAVRATKPQISANASIPYIIEGKPVVTNIEDLSKATAQTPTVIEFGGIPQIGLSLKSFIPYSAIFTDGTKDYSFEQHSQYDHFAPQFPRSKVTPYTVKSVSNACGTTPLNVTTHLMWIGYQLAIKPMQEGKTYCAGEEMIIGFDVRQGTVPAGTVYSLQIRKDNHYTTVATNTTGQDFRYMIPDTMTGRYGVSITTNNGWGASGVEFLVNQKPTATVALNNPAQTSIEYGERAHVIYKVSGGNPWELILKDRGSLNGDYSEQHMEYSLTKATTFELASVSNQCGYGTVSGKVSVTIRPKIVEFAVLNKNVCKADQIRVKYKIGGDIASGEKIGFYLTNNNGTRFELKTVTEQEGTTTLTVPENLGADGYTLTCYVSGTEVKESEYITIQQPANIEIKGNTTINAGESAWITLRSTSRGNIPVDVVLSDGTKVVFDPWSIGAIYNVGVLPKSTITYTIASAKSACGTPQAVGKVVVTVNPSSEKTVQVTSLNKWSPFCENDTILLSYSQTGRFSESNKFTAQFYDSEGKLVKSAPATAVNSSLQVILPAGFSTTDLYRIRLSASDPNTTSGDFHSAMWFGTKASASFGSTEAYLDKDGIAKVAVNLSGTGPWSYHYGNELGSLIKRTDVSPDTLVIASKESAAYFKLLAVYNGCGNGTINEPSIVKIELILGNNEPSSLSEPIVFGPNPTQNEVNIQFINSARRKFTLHNAKGDVILQENSLESNHRINLLQYPSGIYILKIQYPKGEQALKIIKQ